MSTYPMNAGMAMTPYGRTWLRSLSSGVNQLQPLVLQLGNYEWGSALYQRIQRPVVSFAINAGSVLLADDDRHFTEAAIVDGAGNTLAVTPMDVAMVNAPGIIEMLRLRVLVSPSSSRLDQRIKSPAFASSECRVVGGQMDCTRTVAAPIELPTSPDDEFATAPPGWSVEDLFKKENSDGGATGGTGQMLEPDDSIGVDFGFGTRWGMRVRAGWKLPRTRMFMGLEPGFYLHVLKTTRFFHA